MISSSTYKAFLQDHRPQLRFHYRAIAHLLDVILEEEAAWDTFFEHCGIDPVLVLYESFAADPQTATANVLEKVGLEAPADFRFAPRMRRQSDVINDDWAQRFSELRLGSEFDLVPAVPQGEPA
jgi:LPS sulfotransferase NodH